MTMSLQRRAIRRLCITVLFLGAILFIPAGTIRFWPGIVFLLLIVGFWTFFFSYFLRNDPQLLERRLQSKEAQPEQKWILRLFSLVLYCGFILAGLDFRLGWSQRWINHVPLAVIIAGQLFAMAGYLFVFWVMKTNSFAGSTIRVESAQRVIDTGPYAKVRHPMYVGMIIMALGTPLALGSYIALPVFALIVPTLAFRLIHEERVLRRDLPGYAEYCERVRFRLLPGVW
jgi:protein-S-isoprenylcysteine O-methyltransferase Ste14